MRSTVLIVDDEPHARRYLRELLSKDHDIELVGECKNGREALAQIESKKPDILLLDIQMPGINGIEVAHKLKESSCIVIFTTAYDQYALKAFEAEALNYLLKPFNEDRFFKVLDRAKEMTALQQHAQLGEKMMGLYSDFRQAHSPHLTQFTFRENGLDRTIGTADIIYIEARSIYAILNTADDSVLYRAALNLLEQQLPGNFLRIHRSYIINTDHMERCTYLNNNTFSFLMTDNTELISSRSYKTAISERWSHQ